MRQAFRQDRGQIYARVSPPVAGYTTFTAQLHDKFLRPVEAYAAGRPYR
jgi:hypothetical protein